MKYAIVAASWYLLLSVLASCNAPPESPVSLSSKGEFVYDKRLIGTWYRLDRSGSFFGAADAAGWDETCAVSILTVWPADESDVLDAALMLSTYGNESCLDGEYDNLIPHYWEQAAFRAQAFASIIDGRSYLNIKRLKGMGQDYSPDGEAPGFIIAQIEMHDNEEMGLYFLNPGGYMDGDGSVDFAEEGVKTRRSGKLGSDLNFWMDYLLRLDVTRQELQAFVTKTADDRERFWRGAIWSPLPFRMSK